MAHGVGQAEDDVLDLVVDPAAGLEGLGLGVRGEVVEVGLEDPECLAASHAELALRGAGWLPEKPFQGEGGGDGARTNKKGGSHGVLAEVQQELLQCHRLIVDGDYDVAQLRQEELDVLVGELPELVAEDILDAYMVGVAPATGARVSTARGLRRRGSGAGGSSRQV
ncbi:hypothetical protein IMZ48_08030 [Candidatus Bathyarchaeota archaeon]|nr:hypothetical protein [Candidatus Bathyarchaeota archaeon]